MTQDFFFFWHISMYTTKTLQPSFFFFSFMPRNIHTHTTTNISEEYLGNMHISLHIISKIIQSLLGYPPEQLLSLVLCYPPPKSKSLIHPTPACLDVFHIFYLIQSQLPTHYIGRNHYPALQMRNWSSEKVKWWLIRMADTTITQTTWLLILTFNFWVNEVLRFLFPCIYIFSGSGVV